MSSFVASLLEKLYPNQEGRFLCVGLDAAGRTSWLYFKLLGESITTIPTIGFNVETVKHAECSMTFWGATAFGLDVGGCDKIRPLWRHYYQKTNGIVVFIDSNDRERMDEVRMEILPMLDADELRDAFILVIANKQDLPNALTPVEVSERLHLHETLSPRLWTCLPGALGDKQGLEAHFDWLASALRHSLDMTKRTKSWSVIEKCPSQRPTSVTVPNADASTAAAAAAAAKSTPSSGYSGSDEPDILTRWLQVEDEPDEEFLRKLEDYSLESWDHRTHLRLAWLYLTRLGRREGLAHIHQSILAFIQHSPSTARKTGTTYHETMTYFWAHMVHFAIASQKVPPGATSDFKLFLIMNPQLTNGGLFLHYYSKKLMLLSPESRARVVLPDKRPLPSIVSDLSSMRRDAHQGMAVPSHQHQQMTTVAASTTDLADSEFLDRFLTRSLDRWNHECLLRAVYCCLQRHGRRRGGDVALDGLRALQGSDFHLTICCFWLAILTHSLASDYHVALFMERSGEGRAPVGHVDTAKRGPGIEVLALPEWRELLGQESYTSVRVRELIADEHHFLRYYSKQVVFSGAAAAEFVPPDKKPLPSMV